MTTRRNTSRRRAFVIASSLVAPLAGSLIASTVHAAVPPTIEDHWISPVDGLWDNDSNWDQGVAPVMPGYTGIVDLQTGSPYTVGIHTDFSLDGITLNSTDATIDHYDGTVTTASVDITAGLYQLDGGTLSGATITASIGGQFQITQNGGGLDAVTLASDVVVNSNAQLFITSGLSLSNSTVTVSSGVLDFGSGLDQSIQGNGTILLTAGSGSIHTDQGKLTIASGILVSGTGSGTSELGTFGTSTLINRGTLSATGGNTLVINAGTLANTGMLAADSGSTISIQSAVTSLGSFSTSNGTGNVELGPNGILLNANRTTTLGDTLTLNGGTINGGMIAASTGGGIVVGTDGGTLDGTTLAADLSTDGGGSLNVVNGLTLSNSTVTVSNGNLNFGTGTSQTLNGNGTVAMTGTNASIFLNQGTLTIGSGIDVIGEGTYSSVLGVYGNSNLVNDGTLTAANGTILEINAGTFANDGTLLALSGGTVSIDSTIPASKLGSFSTSGGHGTVQLGSSGILLNTGTTTLTDILTLNGGTISGGTITAGTGGQLAVISGTLDGVNLGANVAVNNGGNLRILDSGTLLNSSIAINNGYLDFSFGRTQTLGGSGTVTLTGNAAILYVNQGTLTIGSGVNVIGTGTGISAVGDLSNSLLINHGTFTAGSGNKLAINAGTFSSDGTLIAQSGGTISIDSFVNAGNLGFFSTSGGAGTVELSTGGNLLNTGGTTTLTDILTLNYGTITGGTVGATGSGRLAVGTGGTLDGVTLATNVSDPIGQLTVIDGLTLSNSTITLGGGAILTFGNGLSQTLGGTGTVELTNANAKIIADNGTLNFGSHVNVIGTGTGSGTVYVGQSGTGTLTNSGSITAANGSIVDINIGTFTNNGTMSAMSGSTISIGSVITRGGLGYFTTNGGAGTVELTSTLLNSGATSTLTDILTLNGGTISGGTLSTSGNGALAIGTGGGTLDAVTLASDISLTSTRLNIVNGLALSNATVSLGDGGVLDFRAGLTQSITAAPNSGGGTIQVNSPNAAFYTFNNALTFGPGITLFDAAAGNTGFADYTTALVNNGTIAAGDRSDFFIQAGTFTNGGTLAAQSGGTISIFSTVTPGGLGTINTNSGAGTVELRGVLQNAATTTVLTDVLTLAGGTISGGTLSASGNGSLRFGANGAAIYSTSYFVGGTLDGVTLATNLTLSQGTRLYVANDLTLANATISAYDLNYGDGGLVATGNNSILGSGTILLGGTGGGVFGNAGTLTIGPSIHVVGTNIGGYAGGFVGDTTLVNNGNITAAQGRLYIGTQSIYYPSTLINNGTLEAQSGGTIAIGCTIAPGKLGYFNTNGRAGVVSIVSNGILSNANTTTTLADTLTLDGGTISGGTIAASTGGALRAGPNGGTLSGITLAADFAVPAAIKITNGFTLFGHNISLNNGSITADATGNFAVSGTAAITETGTSVATFGGPLVLAPAAGDQATYTLSTGKLIAQKNFIIAASGVGSFIQTSGTTTITGILAVGNSGLLTSGNGNGKVDISGGTMKLDTLLLGDTNNGVGAFTLSGPATVTVSGGAHLNDLNVNAGTFTVLDQAPPAGEDPELNRAIVGGYLSNGQLNVDGGTVVSPMLKLGITAGKTGTFEESAGTATFNILSLGNDGNLTSGSGIGVGTITGGYTYANTVLLGSTLNGTGDLYVSGTASLTIGGGAHLNDLTVTSGAVTVLNQAPPAAEDPELNRALVGGYLTNGALIISGGKVTSPYVKLGITAGKTGTFTLSGGIASLTGLYLGNDVAPLTAAGIGIADLSGGSLSVGTILIGSANGGVGSISISNTAAVEVSHALTLVAGSHFAMTGGSLAFDPGATFFPADPCIIGNGSSAAKVFLHNATVSSSGSTVTLGSNATLDGGGSPVSGSVGKATFSGTSLTLAGSAATLHLAIGGTNATANAGNTYDQITVGSATFATGGATLQLLPLSGIVLNQAYPVIVATTGGVLDYSQVFSNLTIDPTYSGNPTSYSVSYNPTEIDVTFTAVPEPTAAVAIFAAGCFLRRRRR